MRKKENAAEFFIMKKILIKEMYVKTNNSDIV